MGRDGDKSFKTTEKLMKTQAQSKGKQIGVTGSVELMM